MEVRIVSNAAAGMLTAPVMLERERWLIRLRWLAAGGLFIITAAAYWIFGLGLAVGPIFALAALVAGYNLFLLLWLRRYERRGPAGESTRDLRIMTNIQISLDLLVLILLLHFGGGITNPLGVFMVFHMAIASILLPRLDSYCQAAWASTLYVSLAILEAVFPSLHRPMLGYMAASHEPMMEVHLRPLFVAGECGVLVVTLFLIVYFTSDIAGRLRRVYDQLAQANQELATLEQTKSRFLNVAGHQIRTPLAALYSLMDAIQTAGPGLTTEQREMLQRAQHRAGGMLELINEMLTLSAVKEDLRTATERTLVDAGEILDSVVGLHTESARACNVQLSGDIERATPILAWPNALQDVFGNLISNAIKYTPAEGRVDVTCRSKGKRVIVTVSDTGIGIPVAAQAVLFTEFYRASNARTFAEGTGLGLSIVKELVDRLGGRITICSGEGIGTIVQVDLPRT